MQLRLERVSKHWGTAKAVDGASFATDSGKLVVLLGPSGCGKSTTLRMIAGLDTPSEGRIFIDGRDVTGVEMAAACAINTTAANGAKFSTALTCARLARFTHGGSGEVGGTL